MTQKASFQMISSPDLKSQNVTDFPFKAKLMPMGNNFICLVLNENRVQFRENTFHKRGICHPGPVPSSKANGASFRLTVYNF